MAEGILNKPRKMSTALRAETKDINTKGGNMGSISAAEIAARTTPADRIQWVHTYYNAYHAKLREMGDK